MSLLKSVFMYLLKKYNDVMTHIFEVFWLLLEEIKHHRDHYIHLIYVLAGICFTVGIYNCIVNSGFSLWETCTQCNSGVTLHTTARHVRSRKGQIERSTDGKLSVNSSCASANMMMGGQGIVKSENDTRDYRYVFLTRWHLTLQEPSSLFDSWYP